MTEQLHVYHGFLERAMPSIIGECVKAAGGANEGVLLYRIGYWDRRNLREGQDDRWSKKSHEGWAEDTGLSPTQVKRAVAVLKRANLIELKRGLYDNKNVSHMRLSPRGIALYDGPKTGRTKQCKSAPFYVSENLSDNLSETSEPKVSQEKNEVAKKTEGLCSPKSRRTFQ